ncbi:HD domain-containing protein [Candidatus Falkowbacteria bacterium]|nr:HD domain-containing protein [Candidatus Falkowbacteria bacterium]
MNPKLQKIKELVEKELCHLDPSHNIKHCIRVYNNCLLIAEEEKVDLEVLQAAALLHDIGGAIEMSDQTGEIDHAEESVKMAAPILKDLDFPEDKIKHIQDCIISHRYRNENKPKTIEAKILFDADKLDSLGAIGIARSYIWVAKNNAKIYTNIDDIDVDEYVKENLAGKINGRVKDKTKHSPQLQHETKSKFLADKMHTKKGKEIAKERTKYEKIFLDILEKEIKGEL